MDQTNTDDTLNNPISAENLFSSIKKAMAEIESGGHQDPSLVPMTASGVSMMMGITPRWGSICGIPVYGSPYAAIREQYLFPRSKKKRTRKKWRKDQRNYRNAPQVYMFWGKMYAHSEIVNLLRATINLALKG